MQNPPKTDGGHRRAMSEDCDVIIHDVDDGVVLVVENRDKIMYTMRFDFGISENLKLASTGDSVEKADMKCNIEVQPGTVRNLCHLVIAERETKDHFEMKYHVQCLVRNSKGELEQVKPPTPKEERKDKITDTLNAVFQELPDGYVVFFENSEVSAVYNCKLDMADSENLELMTGPDTTSESASMCSFSIGAGKRVAVAKLVKVDRTKACKVSYRVMQRKETGAAAPAKAPAKAPAAPPAVKEDRKEEITDTLFAIFKESDAGYTVCFESTETTAVYKCKLDIDGSENLQLLQAPTAKAEGETMCSFSVKPGETIAVAKLKIVDKSKDINVSYNVMQRKEQHGGDDGERKDKVTDTLTAIFRKTPEGYTVLFGNSEKTATYKVKLDIGGCENLQLIKAPSSTAEGPSVISFAVAPGKRVPVAKLKLVDPAKGSKVSYRLQHDLDGASSGPAAGNDDDDDSSSDELGDGRGEHSYFYTKVDPTKL